MPPRQPQGLQQAASARARKREEERESSVGNINTDPEYHPAALEEDLEICQSLLQQAEGHLPLDPGRALPYLHGCVNECCTLRPRVEETALLPHRILTATLARSLFYVAAYRAEEDGAPSAAVLQCASDQLGEEAASRRAVDGSLTAAIEAARIISAVELDATKAVADDSPIRGFFRRTQIDSAATSGSTSCFSGNLDAGCKSPGKSQHSQNLGDTNVANLTEKTNITPESEKDTAESRSNLVVNKEAETKGNHESLDNNDEEYFKPVESETNSKEAPICAKETVEEFPIEKGDDKSMGDDGDEQEEDSDDDDTASEENDELNETESKIYAAVPVPLELEQRVAEIDEIDLVHLLMFFHRTKLQRASEAWCRFEARLWERIPAFCFRGMRDYELACTRLASVSQVAVMESEKYSIQDCNEETNDSTKIERSIGSGEHLLEAKEQIEQAIQLLEALSSVDDSALTAESVYSTLGECHVNSAAILELLDASQNAAMVQRHYEESVQRFEQALFINPNCVERETIDDLRTIVKGLQDLVQSPIKSEEDKPNTGEKDSTAATTQASCA